MTRIGGWIDHWRRPRAVVVDGALALAFLVPMVVERAIVAPSPAAVGFSVMIAAGVALRRRVPVAAYLMGSAAMSVEALALTPSPISPYANLIGIYSFGLYAGRRRVWFGPVLIPFGVVAYFAGQHTLSLATPAGVIFCWLLAWALGYSTARRREEQQAAQSSLRQQMVAEERTRMARELHDVIGHTVNVMVVQAGAARFVLERDPDRATALLSTMADLGREALAELDRVLGILRTDDAADPVEPGLGRLPELIRRIGEAGVMVRLELDDEPAPASLSLSAYRIIQEALTNAIRHGQARSATVTVRREGPRLVVQVRDDGRGVQRPPAPGRGLLGIRERVTLLGGTVDYGASADGGFQVRAELPVP